MELMPELHVHILEELERPEEFLSLLDGSVRVSTGAECPEASSCDILVAGVPPRHLVENNPELRSVIIPWSGVPERTRELMGEFPDVSVHNLHHNALQVAEVAVALLLAAAKRIVPMDASLRRDDWSPRYEESQVVLLDGKIVLVLGYGAIGRHVVRLCESLGMDVTAVRRGSSGGADHRRGPRPRVAPASALRRSYRRFCLKPTYWSFACRSRTRHGGSSARVNWRSCLRVPFWSTSVAVRSWMSPLSFMLFAMELCMQPASTSGTITRPTSQVAQRPGPPSMPFMNSTMW